MGWPLFSLTARNAGRYFLGSNKTLKKDTSVSITRTITALSSSDITFGTEVVVR
jgi:hypothetical protein